VGTDACESRDIRGGTLQFLAKQREATGSRHMLRGV
jgi:hypothetical protein